MPRAPVPNASLAKRREALLVQKAALLAELAEIATQQRTRDRQDRLALQAQVGKLADDAGLLAYDLGTLEKVFTGLAQGLQAGQLDWWLLQRADDSAVDK